MLTWKLQSGYQWKWKTITEKHSAALICDDSLFANYTVSSKWGHRQHTWCLLPNRRPTSHLSVSVPSHLLECYLSAHSPGCRSRCPGWMVVTCCARARCIVCWLFSINLSRKNGSLPRHCEWRSQFHTQQLKENMHAMGEMGGET